MLAKSSHTSKIVLLSLLGLIWLLSPQPAIAGDKELIENFWHGYFGNITLPTDPSVFSWELLAKAKIDECYYGLSYPTQNRATFNISYPDDFRSDQVDACIRGLSIPDLNLGSPPGPGHPKVNQAYVWGLAKSGDNVWFGTVAN